MTAETPKHGDLLAALADLPPRKVEKFAIALGVPKNVVEESQINNPKDIYRVKSDALDWWIRNEMSPGRLSQKRWRPKESTNEI